MRAMKIEEGKWKSLTVGLKKKKKKKKKKNPIFGTNYKVSDDSRHYEGVPRRRFIYLFIIHLLMCFLIYLF